MNIVLMHYAAPPIVGGVESVMARHARLMAEDGHRVCIIAGRGSQTDPRVEFSPLPEVDSRHPEILRLKEDLDAGSVPAGFEPMVQRLASQLRKQIGEADRVIAHNICSLNKNLALTAAVHRVSQHGPQGRLILWHHDLAWTTPRYQAELHDGYPWDLLRSDWPWAQQVVVSAQRRWELAELLHVTDERINVIPNGVDIAEFLKLDPETERLRRSLRLSEAAPLMLLPVRITPRKNIELAIRVLAETRTQFKDARLVVTGPQGPHNPANQQYFDSLRALRRDLHLEQAVHFLAEIIDYPISDPVIADLYKLADLLFMPSREEGFGIPVLEAGLSGIPVFCAKIEALEELAGKHAHYFSPDGAPEEIASQITEVLRSSQTYALHKRVLDGYTWEQIYRSRIVPLLEKG